jgi:hypothetical protein
MPKGYSRRAFHKNPATKPETNYKPRTTGWALFPDQREGAYDDIPADALMGAVTAKLLTRGAYTKAMGAFADSVVASFDSSPEIQWPLLSTQEARAQFRVDKQMVVVTFSHVSDVAWRASFDVERVSSTTPTDLVSNSFTILSGVFHAVQEFLEVRQPQELTFASKNEAMGKLYESHLKRNTRVLSDLGYEVAPAAKMSPFTDFTIVKTTPSAYNES